MIGYVYLTKNKINGRPYVGSHSGDSFDKKYLGSGDTLLRAIKKYGRENFRCRILFKAENKEELLKIETYFINKLLKKYGSFAYNIALDGSAPMRGRKHTEETKMEYRKKRAGEKNPMFGADLSGKNNPMFGRKHSEESKKKMSESLSKNRGENHGNFGKIRSKETREKISLSKRKVAI